MNIKRLFGVILLVVATVLLYFGYTASQSVGAPIHESFMSRLTDPTTWYFLSGIASAIGGVVLLTVRIRARSRGGLEFGSGVLP